MNDEYSQGVLLCVKGLPCPENASSTVKAGYHDEYARQETVTGQRKEVRK